MYTDLATLVNNQRQSQPSPEPEILFQPRTVKFHKSILRNYPGERMTSPLIFEPQRIDRCPEFARLITTSYKYKRTDTDYQSLRNHKSIRVTAQSFPIGTLNGTHTVSKGPVKLQVRSTFDGFEKELTCLSIPNITDLVPSEVGQINLSREGQDLYLQKTRLGWVVTGGVAQQQATRAACHLSTLETQLDKFWQIEEVETEGLRSEEEVACEMHFQRNVSRDPSGRYTVRLPFRGTRERLGNSRNGAVKRLLSLERKLNSNNVLRDEYQRVLDEYLALGHMSLMEAPGDEGFYMPHHAVVKEASSTTKVRVVFDASAKTTSGASLNDILLVGPTIQPKLFAHLIRFRTYKYVLTADIEKMYRQVLLHEDDRPYQKILWRRNEKIETYQLNTLTFGVSSSPFLAIRTVHQLADDERESYARAAKILKSHLYVDDLLSGADTIDEARAIRREVTGALSRGGFSIRQWASNNRDILDDLTDNELRANFIVNIDRSLKTLGISWKTNTDEICYTTCTDAVGSKATKRSILSEIARIFDPLGLLGPVVLHAKKIMQDVWRSGIAWDESVPQSIHSEWTQFTQQLELLRAVAFHRRVLTDQPRNIEIHGFCDASTIGYGACLYVRSTGKDGIVQCHLLCAKSRVAPLKTVTIPRLELCGALLLTRLYREASDALDISPDKVVFWSDSTVVLHWIRTAPHRLKMYAATRVAEIQSITGDHTWRHVRSEYNPADALSRGQLPHAFLQNRAWVVGPSWLIKNADEWPDEVLQNIEIPDLKAVTCFVANTNTIDLFTRCSSYTTLQRVIAYCLRFRPRGPRGGSLSAQEIQLAETRIIRNVQTSQFGNEIKCLQAKNTTSKCRIASLNPFLDEDAVLRVGGRLQKSDLPYDQKHPILLPSRHRLTDLIIRETREKHHHTGIQTTLHILRQRFWLLDGRNQVRQIIRSCTRCFRFNATSTEYRMGNLPAVRIREATPFENTGVDFCGPFFIKERKHRNRTRIKTYVCVFVCMAVKAIHLEIVSDLSTEGFLAALRRFAARRGLPAHIFSDNGTNFVGASSQLRELYALLQSDTHRERVQRFASDRRITWHFNPPAAPHFGGLWESMVKLFKHHLRRVVGDSLFTFEELNTLCIEIEGILNSRPITPLSSDPNDLTALTPAHFLIGKALTTLPEGNLLQVPAHRLSTWQHITKVRQDFWTRWNKEYLNELQKRQKWAKDGPNIEVGTVVLLKDRNQPCSQWALGRITALHPGEDGVARAATVKTANGEFKRTTQIMCPLPSE
ncbi:uncharacterized protein LOC143364585 [Halictus rubicundus]|uniref:uncharacterized protein LOC143364585 n=1 Tax=Halictus rubicundus TaxID=77578 RepID=UPI004036DE6D